MSSQVNQSDTLPHESFAVLDESNQPSPAGYANWLVHHVPAPTVSRAYYRFTGYGSRPYRVYVMDDPRFDIGVELLFFNEREAAMFVRAL